MWNNQRGSCAKSKYKGGSSVYEHYCHLKNCRGDQLLCVDIVIYCLDSTATMASGTNSGCGAKNSTECCGAPCCADPCTCGESCECNKGSAGAGGITSSGAGGVTSSGATATAGGYCKCGENCECTVCSCSRVTEEGNTYCKCGNSCKCDPCECLRASV